MVDWKELSQNPSLSHTNHNSRQMFILMPNRKMNYIVPDQAIISTSLSIPIKLLSQSLLLPDSLPWLHMAQKITLLR